MTCPTASALGVSSARITETTNRHGGRMTREELIAALEAATGPNDCWIWPRAKDRAGRGRLWVAGRLMLAHRAVWEAKRGPVPEGMLLCHHCDNPSCVNPKHLYVGTHKDNMRDMRVRRRAFAHRNPNKAAEVGRATGRRNDWAAGTGNPKAKLTVEQVASIRADGRATRFVAAQYGVERTTIQRIRRGSLWTN